MEIPIKMDDLGATLSKDLEDLIPTTFAKQGRSRASAV